MRGGTWFLAAVAALAATAVAGQPPLEFHRVHVPAGHLGDVPLGGDRHVPMPLADFEAAVTRARAGAGAAEPAPPATAARWRAGLDASGALVGTVSCDVGPGAAGPGRLLPLGHLRVGRALRRADPPREATVCGGTAGLALAVPEAGTYEFEFTCAPDGSVFRLPLVPALTTSIVLDLPPGMRPVASGPAARHAVVVPPPAGGAAPWRIDVGPAAELVIAVEPRDRPAPAISVWADIGLSGPRAALAATVVPATPWRAGRLVMEQDPALRVTGVRAVGDDEPLDHDMAGDGRTVSITVPRWLDGSRAPLVVRGVAPATGAVWRLPLLRGAGGAWAGGGVLVRVDPAFAVRDIEFEECRVVPIEAAAAWIRPADAAAAVAPDPRAAIYAVEQQGPGAVLAVELAPREATFDVARVTTVEITPGAVLGRAACDVRVIGGEAFEISARVAPGWIIDAVDGVDWSAVVDGAGERRGAIPFDAALDWRVVPAPAGDALRIGLAAGASARRGIGLRIKGHRAGLAPGAAFTTGDIDMVRFDGEAADRAVVDLRTGADAFVEIGGRPAGWFELDERLAVLAEDGTPRGRIRGGDRAVDVEARVVRRRPPLDVRVDVRLEPRDDVLVQTLTVDCQAAGGVETLVVDFARPGGDGFAWQVDSPAGVVARARPLEPAEGGLASRSAAIEDSWLVELSPPVSGPLRIRAVRSIPFTAAVPVPLAWVEGALEPGGTVTIAAAPGERPRLVNRRLRELPTDPGAAAAPAEFGFDAPLPGSAAELAPVAAGSDARAWAWRETVSCWCDESGTTESEALFDVENEGRDAVTLALAPGRRLESVTVGGVAPPGVEFGPVGGTWRVPLPPGRRRVEIAVRTLAGDRPGRGAWRVDPLGCTLDVPVLDRDVRLLMPPDLVIATPAGAAAGDWPWTARLFAVGATSSGNAEWVTGFRSEPVTVEGDRGPGVLVVRRTLVTGAAILAAVVAGIATYVQGRRRPAFAWLLAVAAAVAALWMQPAFVPVARGAWWGAAAGLAWALRRAVPWRMRGPIGAAATASIVATVATVATVALSSPAVAADGGVRVFVTPGATGETALVPEPLFRVLAPFAAAESAAIRVLGCRIAAPATADAAPWALTLDIDADAGGRLVLDAGPGATWQPPRGLAPGVSVAVVGREARLTAAAAGRRTVDIPLLPAVERNGPVESMTAWIPLAPAASLRVAADVAAGALACERAVGNGPFSRAAAAVGGVAGTAFDVSGADRVRLVRPIDPRDRLASAIRVADTLNELTWDDATCGVDATFMLDVESELLRSFTVRADPRLDDPVVPPDAEIRPRLVPLGGGRVHVQLPEAVRGRVEVRLAARLPLTDPVGVFDVPGLWLEGVAQETRTTRLAAGADFDAAIDPPPAAGVTAADLAGRQPSRVIVRRRRPQIRAAQSLALAFAPGAVGLDFEAQIEAPMLALARIPLDVPVGCSVDRVALLADDPAQPQPVDVVWTRTAADRVLVVVQRPRPGRFRLEVEARLARRPAPHGPLPLVRARLGSVAPLLVTWSAEPPLAVTVPASVAAGRAESVEIPDGAEEPVYDLSVLEAPAPAASPDTGAPIAGEPRRVEQVEVRVVFDGRGRVHGIARLDVVAPEPQVCLRMPPGMRLFGALVDGRVASAEPRAADVWEVPLGAVPWPRTIVVVFAGDAAGAVPEGRPLSLAPPRLEGLPAPAVLWSLLPPAGHELKVAAPARPLDAAALAAVRADARDRIAAACERIALSATGGERERLTALASLRREDRGPAAEEAWLAAGGQAGADAKAAVVVIAAEPLVIRAVPVTDGTAPARAVATVALVVTGGLAWTSAARNRRPRGRP